MRNTRTNMNSLMVGAVLALMGMVSSLSAEEIYVPDYLWKKKITEKSDPIDLANTHLGIPYRDDGALDHAGRFTTFQNPGRSFRTPGLNCSGLVVSVSRFLFAKNFTLDAATADRQNNSGLDAPLGKDWDFGWDLILNLTHGASRRVLMPDGKSYSVDGADPRTARGFDLHDRAAWYRVLKQMKPGRVYLGSISKGTRKKGYKLLHYHVVLILPDTHGKVWLYHATRRSRVHRMDLTSDRGLNRLMAQFSSQRGGPKKIAIVEASLSGDPPAKTADASVQQNAGVKTAADAKTSQVVNLPLSGQSSAGTVRDTRGSQSPQQQVATAPKEESDPAQPPKPRAPRTNTGPQLVLNHLWGRVVTPMPELVTAIPRFLDEQRSGVKLWFRNRKGDVRELEILARGPRGDMSYRGKIPAANGELVVIYPRDFGGGHSSTLSQGKYEVATAVDGVQWLENRFEIAVPREARPRITRVRLPGSVAAGRTFTLHVTAENQGAESDYGGITVSSPDPSALKLVSARPGRIYGRGSTVLSVTSDKIRTTVPMAERWIELWPEKKSYDMKVKVRALKRGTHPIYVRVAVRGVNVKSSVILMDPPTADVADQQGFPVKVYEVTVR